MTLSNPDVRRALRAVIQAVLALALIVLLYWITGKVASNSPVLMAIARGTLIILGIGELFYGGENVTRAFKLSGPAGFGAEFGDDDPPPAAAAQAVADAAQGQADAISEQVKP